jgi:hypothetical protein
VPAYRGAESHRLAQWDNVGGTLMSHYGQRLVGRNIYILENNSVTTDFPLAAVRTIIFGGHELGFLSAADASALTAAGYSVETVVRA